MAYGTIDTMKMLYNEKTADFSVDRDFLRQLLLVTEGNVNLYKGKLDAKQIEDHFQRICDMVQLVNTNLKYHGDHLRRIQDELHNKREDNLDTPKNG